jgi:signal transduction histidine kinase
MTDIKNLIPQRSPIMMVDELLDRVLRLNKAKMAEQGAVLTYQAKMADLLIYADEGQIVQVFNNLIKNAVQAGATSIRITADLNAEDQTVIRVSNNGKAIPLRQIDEIFVPFYTTKSNGTGIGLSLSKQIMVKHNGTLSLEQSDDKVTIFTLVFK